MSSLKGVIAENGYIHLKEKATREEVVKLASSLGELIQIFAVQVKKDPKTVIESHHKMQYHIDIPSARYVLWYCYNEGLQNEKTILTDLADIETQFSNRELGQLCSTKVKLPENYGNGSRIFQSYNRYNLVEKVNGEFLINYTDWLEIDWDNDEIKNKFINYIEEKKKNSEYIYMNKGDVLIIDNRKLLHSRTSLSPETKRCHLRYLVS